MLGMECGRCYPAGVSIRPHDEVDAGTVLNPTQELPKRFLRGSDPAEALASLCEARPLKPSKTYGVPEVFAYFALKPVFSIIKLLP